MTAVYTGARVRFPQYGTTVPADLYAIADAVVIRYWPQAWQRFDCTACGTQTHAVYLPGGAFHRPELGVTVVPRDAFDREPEWQEEEMIA